jgi:hypothetical protein
VFARIAQAGSGGLLIGSSPFFLSQRRQLVALAARHALPTMYNQREYAEAGGLATAQVRQMRIAAPVSMSAEFSKAKSLAICQWKLGPNMSCS